MKRSVLVEGEPGFVVENVVGTNLIKESLQKSNVPLILHSPAVNAVGHQVLERQFLVSTTNSNVFH
jgi:hypothetical protein